MVKKDTELQKKQKKPVQESDEEASEDSDDSIPYQQRHPDNEDQSNKLKLNKFHRFTGVKDQEKKRYVSNKKKIRDLERLLAKEGLPEEIKQAKTKELK